MLAARYGHKRVVELLLTRGAKIHDKKKDGWTALMVAAYNGKGMRGAAAGSRGQHPRQEEGWTDGAYAHSTEESQRSGGGAGQEFRMALDAGLLQPQLRVGLAIHYARMVKHMKGVQHSLGGQEATSRAWVRPDTAQAR